MTKCKKKNLKLNARQHTFYNSEKASAYCFKNRQYVLNFAPDGSFRMKGTNPAANIVSMMLTCEKGDGPTRFSLRPSLPGLNKEVEIPDSPGGHADEPFDLGKI